MKPKKTTLKLRSKVTLLKNFKKTAPIIFLILSAFVIWIIAIMIGRSNLDVRNQASGNCYSYTSQLTCPKNTCRWIFTDVSFCNMLSVEECTSAGNGQCRIESVSSTNALSETICRRITNRTLCSNVPGCQVKTNSTDTTWICVGRPKITDEQQCVGDGLVTEGQCEDNPNYNQDDHTTTPQPTTKPTTLPTNKPPLKTPDLDISR